MEPIQVSFTSKYIDGAQTHISTTPGDTHAGATVADSTQHFTAAGEQINAIITSGQHFIDTAHTMATNVSLMNAIHAEATTTIAPFNFPPPIAHAEATTTWLANALASTNTGDFTSAEHTWRNLANTLSTVVNDVRQAASNLAANNQRPLGINSQTPW